MNRDELKDKWKQKNDEDAAKLGGYKECPQCGEKKLHPMESRNALSRRDNDTWICPDCGEKEGMRDMLEHIGYFNK